MATASTTDVLATLRQAVAAIAPVRDESLTAIAEKFVVRQLARGHLLLTPGDVADSVFLVLDGWLREYFVRDDGTERTKAFVLPGDLGGSAADLISGQKSWAWIAAGVPTTVAVLPYREFEQAAAASAEWAAFSRAILHYVIVAKSRRERELLLLDATGRYQALLDQRPDICDVVPQKYIAQYLGITEVHLSRLRRGT